MAQPVEHHFDVSGEIDKLLAELGSAEYKAQLRDILRRGCLRCLRTESVEQHSDLNGEIDEDVARAAFSAEYEAQLLDFLQRGWSRGPRRIPFNSNYWSSQLKRCHRQLRSISKIEERVRRAQKAAALAPKALHSVRKLIEALPHADAELLSDIVEPVLRVVSAQQSSIARNQPSRTRGGQTDSSQISQLALILLLDCYLGATGHRPTKYEGGPFVAFAAAMLGVPEATILRHLKRVLNLLQALKDTDPIGGGPTTA